MLMLPGLALASFSSLSFFSNGMDPMYGGGLGLRLVKLTDCQDFYVLRDGVNPYGHP